jgi:hypothetical protein
MDAPGMAPPPDPPPGLLAVRVPKPVLLLTKAEYLRDVKRGTWRKWSQAEAKCEADASASQIPRAPRGFDTHGCGLPQVGQKECEKH